MTPKAAKVLDLLALSGVTSQVIGDSDVFYSNTFVLPGRLPGHSIECQFSSDGVVNVKLELEQGNTELTDAQEGASHADYVVPENMSDIQSAVTDENTHHNGIAPIATAFARVKITGLTGTDATTTLTKLKLATIKE